MRRAKPGDYVKIVDSGIAGYCVEIKDDDTLIVETADGLMIPVKNTLIVISEHDHDLSVTTVGSAGRKDRPKGRSGDKKSPGLKPTTGSSPVVEIDLHTTLKSDVKAGPLPADILSIQIDRFSAALRRAVAENRRELVAIHGEGSGRLKSEIRRITRELYPRFEVMDAPYHKYGSGATRIIIKP